MLGGFTFRSPREIVFGPGARARLSESIRHFGTRVAVIIGQTWFEQDGWKGEFDSILDGFEVSYAYCPAGEPTTSGVKSVCGMIERKAPDVLIAVGGGSGLDTAKDVSAAAGTGNEVEDYLEGVGIGRQLEAPGLPWVAMPTTAGTGTEVTRNAVIKVPERGFKKSIRSAHLIATCAVVDPEMTLALPKKITGMSGMDALTQLIEAYVSRKRTPVTSALVTDAFPRMLGALKALSKRTDDLEARTDASYGALISGLALGNAGLGAAHGFASGLGGLFDIPHGLICSSFIGPVLEANASVIRDLVGELRWAALGEGGKGDPVEWLVGEVTEILGAFGLEGAIREYSVPKKRFSEIAERSSGSSMSGNPRELSLAERERLLARVLG